MSLLYIYTLGNTLYVHVYIQWYTVCHSNVQSTSKFLSETLCDTIMWDVSVSLSS
jgi:hypothetical protein